MSRLLVLTALAALVFVGSAYAYPVGPDGLQRVTPLVAQPDGPNVALPAVALPPVSDPPPLAVGVPPAACPHGPVVVTTRRGTVVLPFC